MADLGDTSCEVKAATLQNKDQPGRAATAQVITNESSSKKTTKSRRFSIRHLSAIDRDMMEWSTGGEVRYEDQKGLGGCRIQ
ncbi:unnamed protein product [Calypogeia fissa]